MKLGYVRGEKTELQIDALREYGVDEIYKEYYNNTQQKYQLTKLLENLRSGDTLVIYNLNKLGRTVKQLLVLIKDFENRGINLVSISECIDTSTTAGRFILSVFCKLLEMESDVIAERTKIGLTAAKNNNSRLGRKPKNHNVVEKALKMYFSNEYSIKNIIEETGLSKTTIYKYVREYKEGK